MREKSFFLYISLCLLSFVAEPVHAQVSDGSSIPIYEGSPILGLSFVVLTLVTLALVAWGILVAIGRRCSREGTIPNSRFKAFAVLVTASWFVLLFFVTTGNRDLYELFPIYYEYSPEQEITLAELGLPDSFSISFSPGTDGDNERVETWSYHDYEIELTFVNGSFVGENDIEPMPQGYQPTPFEPADFSGFMTSGFVSKWLGQGRHQYQGDDIRVSELIPELFAGVPLDIVLYENIATAFDLNSRELIYIETYAVAPQDQRQADVYLIPSHATKSDFSLIAEAAAADANRPRKRRRRSFVQKLVQPVRFVLQRKNQALGWVGRRLDTVRVLGKPVGKRLLTPALNTQVNLMIPPALHTAESFGAALDKAAETRAMVKGFKRGLRQAKEAAQRLRTKADKMVVKARRQARELGDITGSGELTQTESIALIKKANDARDKIHAIADHIDKVVKHIEPERVVKRLVRQGIAKTIRIIGHNTLRIAGREVARRLLIKYERLLALEVHNQLSRRTQDVIDLLLKSRGAQIKITGPRELVEAIKRGKVKEAVRIKWGPGYDFKVDDFDTILKEVAKRHVPKELKRIVKETLPERMAREELKGTLMTMLPGQSGRIERLFEKIPSLKDTRSAREDAKRLLEALKKIRELKDPELIEDAFVRLEEAIRARREGNRRAFADAAKAIEQSVAEYEEEQQENIAARVEAAVLECDFAAAELDLSQMKPGVLRRRMERQLRQATRRERDVARWYKQAAALYEQAQHKAQTKDAGKKKQALAEYQRTLKLLEDALEKTECERRIETLRANIEKVKARMRQDNPD